jgi:hypothetical protein
LTGNALFAEVPDRHPEWMVRKPEVETPTRGDVRLDDHHSKITPNGHELNVKRLAGDEAAVTNQFYEENMHVAQ